VTRRAIVVGGSLGGLAAGSWLRDAGFEVEIVERASKPLEDRGAGIVLHPATVRYLLERCGLSVEDIGVGVGALRFVEREAGIVAERQCHLRFASYGAIYRQLLASFPPDCYHLGRVAVAVRESLEGAVVELADGSHHAGDVVVCADGIRSTCRRQLAPAEPVYAGYVAWRGVAAESELSAGAAAVLSGAITYTILPRGHLLTYPIASPRGLDRNWVWYLNVEQGNQLEDLLVDPGGRRHDGGIAAGAVRAEHVEHLRLEAARLLPPSIVELLARTAAPFIQVVYDLESSRLVFGSVCLVGDAAFVARPHAAAGTAKACEDAFVLAEALRDAPDVRTGLARFEAPQLALGRRLVERARRVGTSFQFEGSFRPGDPLPFGLREVGDSEFG
jgi:2,6-dihydroxypyridine 3-monooxygenase